jgi:hypothetical protein
VVGVGGEERGKAGEEALVAYLEAKRVAREVGAQEGVLECSYEDWTSVDQVVRKAIRVGIGGTEFFLLRIF